ncbi:glycosyltransferase [Providencia stuartii]
MKILHISPHVNFSLKFIEPLIIEQLKINQQVFLNTHMPNTNENLDIKVNKSIFKTIKNIFKLIKVIRKEKIDLVYCHTTVDSFLPIIFFKLLTSAKVYYINHGVSYIGHKGIIKSLLYLIEVSNVNLANKVFTITNAMYLPIKKCILSKKKQIYVLKPGTIVGVEHKYTSYNTLINQKNKNDELTILYVGRPEKRKGLFDIIKAVSYLNFKFKLILIGVDSNNISSLQYNKSNIIPVGYIKDPSEFFLHADILCVPSLHEGFGQVYLEAAAYGVIPISCDIPGPTDFIKNRENGFTAPLNSPEYIAKIITELYHNPILRYNISKNAFLSSKKYSRNIVLNNNIDALL